MKEDDIFADDRFAREFLLTFLEEVFNRSVLCGGNGDMKESKYSGIRVVRVRKGSTIKNIFKKLWSKLKPKRKIKVVNTYYVYGSLIDVEKLKGEFKGGG